MTDKKNAIADTLLDDISKADNPGDRFNVIVRYSQFNKAANSRAQATSVNAHTKAIKS